MHYTIESVIASSECTTLKHPVPGKRVLNVLFVVTVTFNQADALKLGSHGSIHKRFSFVATGLDWFQS